MMDLLILVYPWVKAFHLISVMSWMAGMFYLPRLFVYHAETAEIGTDKDATFRVMERKLLKFIMNPAMIATWVFGLILVVTPGVVDWSAGWSWIKAASVIAMTGVHGWLAGRQKVFARGENALSGRTFRIMNEAPTLLMLIIVIFVVVKPF